MKKFYFALLLLISTYFLSAQGIITSKKCFGGTNRETAYGMAVTNDGGYIFVGYTSSTDGDVAGLHNNTQGGDAWAVKANSDNTIQWSKCLGGTKNDELYRVIVPAEGGYLLVGLSESNDGDVTQNKGSIDGWVVKLDDNGNIRWQKTVGGTGTDNLQDIMQNRDGNYILTGYTMSSDNGLPVNRGSADAWMMEMDTAGNILWQQTYGGPNYEQLSGRAAQDADGNYYLAGFSDSVPGLVSHGEVDLWAIKTNSTGQLLSQKYFGGSRYDYAICAVNLGEGIIALIGGTQSPDGDVNNYLGGNDGWIVAVNTSLEMQWQTTIGGADDDQLNIAAVKNGLLVAVGTSVSSDGVLDGMNHGEEDMYVVCLNTSGSFIGQNCYGGNKYDVGIGMALTNSSELYLCGSTESNNGNMVGNHGKSDAWVGKTILPTTITEVIEQKTKPQQLSIYPNPATGSFQVKLVSEDNYAGTMQVINLLDETVSTKNVDVQQGNNTFLSTTSTLPKGMYVLQIANATGKNAIQKLIIE